MSDEELHVFHDGDSEYIVARELHDAHALAIEIYGLQFVHETGGIDGWWQLSSGEELTLIDEETGSPITKTAAEWASFNGRDWLAGGM